MRNIKFLALIILSFLLISCLVSDDFESNKINRDNYYDYLIKRPIKNDILKNDWIRREECIKIISAELEKMGYKIRSGVLFRLNEKTIIAVDGFEPYKKFGYVVQEGHAADIKKSDRTKNKPFEYMIYDRSGIPLLTYTSDIPENIFIFKEDGYWYQETQNTKIDNLVTKDIAIQILLEDLHYYLKKFNSTKI